MVKQKVWIVANLDQDWGSGIKSVHKTEAGAKKALSNIDDEHDRAYTEICEIELDD